MSVVDRIYICYQSMSIFVNLYNIEFVAFMCLTGDYFSRCFKRMTKKIG